MTQHEYVFVAISIILGLAITRLLHSVAGLIRAHRHVRFHWATALWGLCVMLFILQMWWVGWELHVIARWTIVDFMILVVGSIFLYGAADLALPLEDYDVDDDTELNFIGHSRSLGRISALSMLGYFCIGPYVNVTLFGNSLAPSIGVPILGGLIMLLIVLRPAWFDVLTVIFALYACAVMYLTA